MRYLSAHEQHIGARKYQQDAFAFADADDDAFIEHGGFLAVLCDGMGGMEHGDLASQTAIATLVAEYGKKDPSETIPDALLRSVRETNSRVVSIASGLGSEGSMGTTLIAAVVHGGHFYFISVGDSALFHVRDLKLQLVNHPHVFGDLLDRAVETGTISRDEADVHPEREALTSFVGITELSEIDRNADPLPLAEGETLLFATDGLFKTLDAGQMEAELKGHPQSWPSKLVAATLNQRHAGQDNITVLTVTLDAPGLGPWKGALAAQAVTEVLPRVSPDDLSPRRHSPDRNPPGSDAVAPVDEHGHRTSRRVLIAAILAIVLLAIAAAVVGYRMGQTAGV
jgi:PPM family protein phosphatase